MTTIPLPFITISLLFAFITPLNALGSDATFSVTSDSGTVCGILARESNRRIVCYKEGRIVPIRPNISYSAISAGRRTFCALRSGGYSLLCWDDVAFQPKRIYLNAAQPLRNIAINVDQVCGILNNTGSIRCWRISNSPMEGWIFDSISSGVGFSCGILRNSDSVRCWGENGIGRQIEDHLSNVSMSSIAAGGSHACGLDTSGFVVCKGSNSSGQLNSPKGSAMEYFGLAMGSNHSCAIRRPSGTVVCWGGSISYSPPNLNESSFVSIASSSNFTCGITTRNFSISCWGPGWSNPVNNIPIPTVLPGQCVESTCNCGIYPLSESLCLGRENICLPDCPVPTAIPPSELPRIQPPSRPSKSLSNGLLAFAIVGSVGCLIGISIGIYSWWSGILCGHKKIHNSVQPNITGVGRVNSNSSNQNSRSFAIQRHSSRIIRRQRSGPSSKHADNCADEFSFSELVKATNNFAVENKIGSGSFGIVYKGKLPDGRRVAIKRGDFGAKPKKSRDNESAFESEISFLSRLHHKHLVRLVGFCEEKDERLLVYDYMKNGALYDHLHGKENVSKQSSMVNSWRKRIKISLDAARGIEYLHNYAVPPIIHRDIKSSNILLDSNWTARVSDFGLSLMGPIPEHSMKAAGTVGYIDPEYYGLNVVTEKSDVYGMGVVLLEILTGKRATFKPENDIDDNAPVSIVDYAVPRIVMGDLGSVLDKRVGQPEVNETEAVELVAYTAMHCVNLVGKERPSMTDIVSNLERAVGLCEEADSHGSISSGGITVISE